MLIDTYAWIEFFSNMPKAFAVKKIIDGKAIYTSILSIAEFKLWALRNNINSENYLKFIEENSTTLNLTNQIALLAAEIRFNAKPKNFGLIDALIYSTALTYDLTLLTGDKHFKEMQKVTMI